MSCIAGFGEVNIPSSRAFWDDCEEDEPLKENAERLQLTFQPGQSEEPIAAEKMLIIEGVKIFEFAEKVLLQEASKICDIPSKKSSLHSAKNQSSILIAIIDEDLTNSGEITELLLPYAKIAGEVITLSVKSKIDYKSLNIAAVENEITFLRGLNTQMKHIDKLETPNFITGVTAGVASWRESENLPVSSYVAYTDKTRLDTLAAKPILKLLTDLGFKCASTYVPKFRDDSYLYN